MVGWEVLSAIIPPLTYASDSIPSPGYGSYPVLLKDPHITFIYQFIDPPHHATIHHPGETDR